MHLKLHFAFAFTSKKIKIKKIQFTQFSNEWIRNFAMFSRINLIFNSILVLQYSKPIQRHFLDFVGLFVISIFCKTSFSFIFFFSPWLHKWLGSIELTKMSGLFIKYWQIHVLISAWYDHNNSVIKSNYCYPRVATFMS